MIILLGAVGKALLGENQAPQQRHEEADYYQSLVADADQSHWVGRSHFSMSNCRAKLIPTLYQLDSDWPQVSYALTL